MKKVSVAITWAVLSVCSFELAHARVTLHRISNFTPRSTEFPESMSVHGLRTGMSLKQIRDYLEREGFTPSVSSENEGSTFCFENECALIKNPPIPSDPKIYKYLYSFSKGERSINIKVTPPFSGSLAYEIIAIDDFTRTGMPTTKDQFLDDIKKQFAFPSRTHGEGQPFGSVCWELKGQGFIEPSPDYNSGCVNSLYVNDKRDERVDAQLFASYNPEKKVDCLHHD